MKYYVTENLNLKVWTEKPDKRAYVRPGMNGADISAVYVNAVDNWKDAFDKQDEILTSLELKEQLTPGQVIEGKELGWKCYCDDEQCSTQRRCLFKEGKERIAINITYTAEKLWDEVKPIKGIAVPLDTAPKTLIMDKELQELKFKGKRIDTGEWVHGSYHSCVGEGVMRVVEWAGSKRKVIDKPVQFNKHWILVPNKPDSEGWTVHDTYRAYSVIPESVSQCTDTNSPKPEESNLREALQKFIKAVDALHPKIDLADQKQCDLYHARHMVNSFLNPELYQPCTARKALAPDKFTRQD